MENARVCENAYIADSSSVEEHSTATVCNIKTEHKFAAPLAISAFAPDEVLEDADRDCGAATEPSAKRAKPSMPPLIDSDVECDGDSGDDSDAEGAAVETIDAFLKRTMNMSYYDYCMTCDSQIPDLPVAHWKPA